MPSAYFTLFYSFEVELHLSPNGDGNMEIMKMERLESALRLIFNLQSSIYNLSRGSRRGLYSSIAFTLNLIALACASSCSFSAMHTTALPILLIPSSLRYWNVTFRL